MVVGFSPTPEEDLEEKNKLLSMVVVLLERELETEPELEGEVEDEGEDKGDDRKSVRAGRVKVSAGAVVKNGDPATEVVTRP